MVEVVTQQAAEANNAEVVQAAEESAATEMAEQAQEAPVEEKPAEAEAPSSEVKEWEGLLDESDEDELPEEMQAEVKPVEEEPKPEETPVVEEPTPETPLAEEKDSEEEKPADVEIPLAEEPQDTRTPEDVQKEITVARSTARDNLVKSFEWTEEQTEQFEEDPGKVMSSMAADLFLDLYDSITQSFRTQMPGMVNGILAQQTAAKAHEQQFYNAWPKLAKPEYRETINRVEAAYRQQNPATDNATAVQEIGAQAWVALKLPLEELIAQASPQQKSEEVVPFVAAPSRIPASAGNAPQSARTPALQATNDFEILAEELLDDDIAN